MSEVCPICFKKVAAEALMDHVNSCLDNPAEPEPQPQPQAQAHPVFPQPNGKPNLPPIDDPFNGLEKSDNEDIIALYKATEARRKKEEEDNERHETWRKSHNTNEFVKVVIWNVEARTRGRSC